MTPIHSEDCYVPVPGGELFVRQWVPDLPHNQEPLVLLHDSLGSVELWRNFPEALARTLGRHIIAYDRLGFGKSTARHGLPSFGFIEEEATLYFPALRDALGLGSYALFGHSVGGGMALTIAAHDAACMAVISESAQAFIEPRTLEGITVARAQFDQPGQLDRLARWHGDKAQWVLDAWTEVWRDPAFAAWSLDPWLGRVRCPTLVIHGDSDEYGSVAFPRRIAAGVVGPVEMVIMEGCGHVPHRERQDEVLAHVSRFLSG